MLDVGDLRVATLTVQPADGSTAVTLTVIRPDGTTLNQPVTVVVDGGVATATADAYQVDQPGEWIEQWVVSGTGAGTERASVRVAPAPTDAPAARVYATTADYARWLGAAPPEGSRRALREASRVVERMTMTAVYSTDSDGYPTDERIRDAFRDATCAQAEYARTNGDPQMVGVLHGGLSQWSIGGLSAARTVPDNPFLPAEWSPVAWDILRRAGLTNGQPFLEKMG